MYLYPLIHLSRAGLVCVSSDRHDGSNLAWSQTWPQVQCSPVLVVAPLNATRVCRMCVRNTITFSTQADVFVALQPANIGSFSSPLFPHLLKESHLFRCLLRSFFHSFCLNRHIVLSQHSSSQPGQNQLHRELSWTWPVIWGTRGQSDGKKTDLHRRQICVGFSG